MLENNTWVITTIEHDYKSNGKSVKTENVEVTAHHANQLDGALFFYKFDGTLVYATNNWSFVKLVEY